jgi:predicted metal-dependent hydrolase
MRPRPAAQDNGLLKRGIQLFNAREYFVCHEVLEEAWTPERGPRRLFLQSLIHVAVGLYHAERGNPVGASRQLRKALRKLGRYLPEWEGVDTGRLHRDAREALAAIEAGTQAPEIRIHLMQKG